MIENIYWSSCKVRVILVRFQLLLNFRTDLRKISDIKFNENLFSGSRVVLCGQTDEQTDQQT